MLLNVTTQFQLSSYSKERGHGEPKCPITAMIEIKEDASDNAGLLRTSPGIPALFHLALVIDISASMEENQKLQMVQKAATYLIQHIPVGNRISIVTFAETVNIVVASQTIETPAHRQRLVALIQALKPGQNTNLFGGLLGGIEVLTGDEGAADQPILILLTDGMANMGVTSEEAMKFQFSQVAKPQSFQLYSIGVADGDQKLNRKFLEQVSVDYEGHFYWIRNSDDIASCFGDIVGTLLSQVARDIRVTLRVNSGSLAARGGPPMCIDEAQIVQWLLPDLLVGEQRNLVFGWICDPEAEEAAKAAPSLQVDMEYVSLMTGKIHKAKISTPIPFAARTASAPAENTAVTAHIWRYLVCEAVENQDTKMMATYRKLIMEDVVLFQKQRPIIQRLLDEMKVSTPQTVSSLQRQRTGFISEFESKEEDVFMSPARVQLQRAYSEVLAASSSPLPPLTPSPPPLTPFPPAFLPLSLPPPPPPLLQRSPSSLP